MKSSLALFALMIGAPTALAQQSADGIVTPGVDKLKQEPTPGPVPTPVLPQGPENGGIIVRPLPKLPPVTVAPARPVPIAPTIQPSAPRSTPERPVAERPAQSTPAEAQEAAPFPTLPPAAPLNVTPAIDNGATIDDANVTDATQPAETPQPEEDRTPWLIGGGVVIAAITAFLFLRRRRIRPVEDDVIAAETLTAEGTAQEPVSVAAAPVRRTEEDRPRLIIGFVPQTARVTLVGAAVGYRLTIKNDGPRAAEDVMLTGIMTNADAQQQGVLANFFANAPNMVGDAIGRIEPGQMLDLEGEMRIGHERILPIEVQGRKLLIPVIALNLSYHWTRDQRIDRGNGRNGAAFIIGQESDPPREKMAPFRLDQGPRQYRTVGVRPAQNPVSD